MKYDVKQAIICVIGLGYVGLAVAEAFSKSVKVIGYDIAAQKVDRLNYIKQQKHPTDSTNSANLTVTSDPTQISQADFIIICVPTGVTMSKNPDLSHIESAAKTVSQFMKRGSMVILESTVYPGVTEEVLKPILEESGMKCGDDFSIAYSPERINPGDKEHRLDQVTKLISGMDEDTVDVVAELYRMITPHLFKVKDIKTAEAAKVIENIQRDLNIALVNELALIFDKMGLSTRDVLEAAATKWNFHFYLPGLVGGHCIPVDPYYLVYKAKEVGYHPQVILAGRAINDYMPKHVVEITIKALNNSGKVIKNSKVLIMGLTYKENVADTRETPVKVIIKELKEYGVEIFGYDPLLDNMKDDFGIKVVRNLESVLGIDGVILAAAHDAFRGIALDDLKSIMNTNPILVDVREYFNKDEAEAKGFFYKSL